MRMQFYIIHTYIIHTCNEFTKRNVR